MTPHPHAQPSNGSTLAAEAIGTFVLVFAIMGTAIFGSFLMVPDSAPVNGTVMLSTALGAGIAITISFYAFGPISGGHFNPAVTLGLAAAGRFDWHKVMGYVVAQVVGGVLAVTAAMTIGVFGPDGWLATAQEAGFASNGFGEHSPGGFGVVAAMIIEVIIAAILLLVVLGVTSPQRPSPSAGMIMGLAYAVLTLIAIPVDNAALNPARAIATALYGGSGALVQLWVFVVFPILGALLAGYTYKALLGNIKR